MATIFHGPASRADSTYDIGIGFSDTLTFLGGSVLSNQFTIVDIFDFPSTVVTEGVVFVTLARAGFVRSTASDTVLTFSTLTNISQQPDIPGGQVNPLISIFKAALPVFPYGSGLDAVITNNGILESSGIGATVIRVADGGNHIRNTGTIRAEDQSGFNSQIAISIHSDRDVTGVNAPNLIENFGVIESLGPPFGLIAILTSHDDDRIVNHGHITGDVRLQGGDDVFENAGTMEGWVFLGAGNDRFEQQGTGTPLVVTGGDGDDTYVIDNPTGWTLVEFAGGGTDTISVTVDWTIKDTEFENLTLRGTGNLFGQGNDRANVITGNAGNNVLAGRGGDDTIFGAEGDDRLRGHDGHDTLDGGAGNDVLVGHDGNDVLAGGEGDDRLHGQDGDDVLDGGAGRDVLRGGAGADVFVFWNVTDSVTGTGRDVIVDFETGTDRLDLLPLLPEDLVWRGEDAFTGTAAEVRVTLLAGRTRLAVDADGDGAADMEIMLHGVTDLAASDIIL